MMKKDDYEVTLDKEGVVSTPVGFVEFEEDVQVSRGEIFFVEAVHEREHFLLDNSKQFRPCVIVSNDRCNAKSAVVSVIYLSTSAPEWPRTNVGGILCRGRESVAVCSQVVAITKSRLREWAGVVDDEKMQEIDAAIGIALGLDCKMKIGHDNEEAELKQKVAKLEAKLKEAESAKHSPNLTDELSLALAKANSELKCYKSVYEQLLEKLV